MLAGLSADVLGIPTRVDPAELDAMGVVLAIAQGRSVYVLRQLGISSTVYIDMWSWPFGERTEGKTMVAQHACSYPQ